MKAAIYCRLSKEDEDLQKGSFAKESESIQNQKSMLINYAIENGYDIYHIYSDEDYSGIDRDRPDFKKMIEAASQHKFDIILAKTQSRFTRDMELVERYLHGDFIEWGIRFIAVVDRVDTADIANKKSRQINGLVNEWYLEDSSNSVRAVLDHKRKEGKYIASFALYGYKKDPADKNRLIIDEEAAETVRRIFTLFLAGNGTTRIARYLNEQKVPSPTQYKHEHGINYKRPARCENEDIWGKATIYQMLKNRTYMGDLEQGRHKKISYKSKKTIWLPRDEWVVVPKTHEGIIDAEAFERVQKLLSARARGGGKGVINPLAGKVFCGICGSSMEQTGSGYSPKNGGVPRKYFRCRMSQRDRTRCTGQDYMPLPQLQEIVLERIQYYVTQYQNSDEFKSDNMVQRMAKKKTAKQAELDHLRNEINRRRKAMQELYLDKSGGLINNAQFAQLNQSFLDDVDEMEKRCFLLDAENENPRENDETRALVEKHLADAQNVKSLSRELVCLLIEKIVILPPDTLNHSRKVEISWLI